MPATRTVARTFTHYDEHHKKGDKLPADHPLVELAPHLFVPTRTKPEPDTTEPKRIRGPLVNTKE